MSKRLPIGAKANEYATSRACAYINAATPATTISFTGTTLPEILEPLQIVSPESPSASAVPVKISG
jgi:hypothetical protein